LHWRDNSDYTALGPTPRPVYRALDMNIGPISSTLSIYAA